MKGYLNDKEAVSLFCVEEYEDGTSDFDATGNSIAIMKLLLDTVVVTLLAEKKADVSNEEMANFVRNYVLGTMDMIDEATKGGVFNDLR